MLTAVKGKNYLTAPGCSDIMNLVPESLENCIQRIFNVDLFEKSRKQEVVYAKHFYRYVLERLDKNNQLTDKKRIQNVNNNSLFKFSLYTIALLLECHHANIVHSSKTAKNLMETDKAYREKCQIVIDKIKANLIVMP